ncbi:MAG: molybdopterin molybdotransferase MoeA [Sandaracinaceae bacterium]|nr:molybdopterin molybdotransferase MoeA [Sandaracinaceae bacterium]
MSRISLEEAITRALGAATLVATEPLPLAQLSGRVLAEDLDFGADLPPFDHAAMDGYAIAGAAPSDAAFSVVGESRAGAPASEADRRFAMTISTGAAIPPGLDTVVPWEDVSREGDRITLRREARAGQHVRKAGEDARRGTRALSRGTRLSARHVALLATLERDHAVVSTRPRVAILCTGDELRDPGSAPRPGSIVDSNGPMLAALVAQGGGAPVRHRVPDTREAVHDALSGALDDAELVITIGGAADGVHDHVMPTLESLGAETLFRGVAIKPGKPVALARSTRGDRVVPVLALPGNPGSAFVTFTLIGLPLLRAMQGDLRPRPRTSFARAARAMKGAADREVLAYGAIHAESEGTHEVFVPAPSATSGSIPGLASASAIAIVPAGASLAEGELARVIEVERA